MSRYWLTCCVVECSGLRGVRAGPTSRPGARRRTSTACDPRRTSGRDTGIVDHPSARPIEGRREPNDARACDDDPSHCVRRGDKVAEPHPMAFLRAVRPPSPRTPAPRWRADGALPTSGRRWRRGPPRVPPAPSEPWPGSLAPPRAPLRRPTPDGGGIRVLGISSVTGISRPARNGPFPSTPATARASSTWTATSRTPKSQREKPASPIPRTQLSRERVRQSGSTTADAVPPRSHQGPRS